MTASRSLALGFALAALAACSSTESTPDPGAAEPAPRYATGWSAEEIAHAGEEAGVHHLAEVAPGLLRGAQPGGDASFALLARLGVRTILSVDGARPDVEGAALHGIRYVHIPIEYSGLSRGDQVKIAKAALTAEGNLFVHCHHGKHRGPAAGGICWMTLEGVSGAAAVADMRRAGTDPKYEGLYRDVGSFVPAAAEELARVTDADLPPAARVSGLVESMVGIDGSYSRMKAVRAAGWATPPSMPDVAPAHEARILAERFREFRRLESGKGRPADFLGWAEAGEKAAWEVEAALRAGDGAAAGTALVRVGASCTDCHGQYRNK